MMLNTNRPAAEPVSSDSATDMRVTPRLETFAYSSLTGRNNLRSLAFSFPISTYPRTTFNWLGCSRNFVATAMES